MQRKKEMPKTAHITSDEDFLRSITIERAGKVIYDGRDRERGAEEKPPTDADAEPEPK